MGQLKMTEYIHQCGGQSSKKKEDLENKWSARMNCVQVFKLR